LRAVRRAGEILRTVRPDIVFSKGGYVSVPVCLAARRRRIPIVLHESDAVSGYANRFVGLWADRVCLGFPSESTKDPRCTITGNPVRAAMTQGSREEGLRLTGFSGERPVLLVLGGSQGAHALNEAIAEHFHALAAQWDVIHITGRGKSRAGLEGPHSWNREFVMGELPHLYAIADLALSRAGAGVVAELAANGIPAILVPLRGVGHDHQQRNALAAAATGGCRVLQQEDLPRELPALLRSLAGDAGARKRMGAAIRKLHHPDASRQIVKIIAGLLD
jgi:UDP-N-acetylglucosamine--N-acetylmuramyl-(pentapeptide) pyrophosphoryl-undecaprenol N-acetylglucosamine transferase